MAFECKTCGASMILIPSNKRCSKCRTKISEEECELYETQRKNENNNKDLAAKQDFEYLQNKLGSGDLLATIKGYSGVKLLLFENMLVEEYNNKKKIYRFGEYFKCEYGKSYYTNSHYQRSVNSDWLILSKKTTGFFVDIKIKKKMVLIHSSFLTIDIGRDAELTDKNFAKKVDEAIMKFLEKEEKEENL